MWESNHSLFGSGFRHVQQPGICLVLPSGPIESWLVAETPNFSIIKQKIIINGWNTHLENYRCNNILRIISMIFHCKWAIFHCYVKYPEGMGHLSISNLMIFLGVHCWICPSYPHEGWCSNPFPMLNTPQPKPGVSINTIGSMHFGAHLTGERMGCPWNYRKSGILGTKRSSYPPHPPRSSRGWEELAQKPPVDASDLVHLGRWDSWWILARNLYQKWEKWSTKVG